MSLPPIIGAVHALSSSNSINSSDNTVRQSNPAGQQRVSFSGCNGVLTYTCGLASLQMWQFLFVDVAIQPEVRFIVKQNFAYENREQRQSRFGPIRRIYALLDDRFDGLPNQTENKSLDSC
ncbi:hypothetical protein TNCV_4727081 [Trichonephila clavipes]|nr:hypothetical protein TNCV_4727081 [Trichonephila clavipes]